MSILGISQTVTVDRNMLIFADKYAISWGEKKIILQPVFSCLSVTKQATHVKVGDDDNDNDAVIRQRLLAAEC